MLPFLLVHYRSNAIDLKKKIRMIYLSRCFFIVLIGALSLYSCSDETEPPIEEMKEIGAPGSIQVFDIGNDGNSQDVRIFFNAGFNFSDVKEYRAIFTKSSNAGNLDVTNALILSSGLYYTFQNSSQSPRLNMIPELKDTDGDPVVNGLSYNLFVLAIPKIEGIEAKLSSKSPDFTLTEEELKDIYISSRSGNSVELFDGITGEHIKSFVSANSGGLSAPQEVIFLDDGDLIVTGRFNSAIKKYDGITGSFKEDFTSGYTLDNPTKTNIGPDGHLYVSQWGAVQNSIVRFNLKTGAFIDEVVPSFSQGMDHAWDSSGNMYVVSFGLKQLRKYNTEFNLEQTTTNQLTGPVNVWIDVSNTIYVVDWEDGTVKRYNDAGVYIDTFISGLSKAEGFVFDGPDLYICDWADNVVNIYNSLSGTFKKSFINSNKIQQPNSISFGPDQRPN
jgi:hypothetical protein